MLLGNFFSDSVVKGPDRRLVREGYPTGIRIESGRAWRGLSACRVLVSVWLLGLVLILGTSVAMSADVELSLGGNTITKRVKSFKELRDQGVIRQQQDYSCGAAALATILDFQFQDRVTEQEVIGFIFIHGQTPEEGIKKYLRRQGFSLLDLKRFAEFQGYKTTGYKGMTLDDLVETLNEDRTPILVPISLMGYNHFVVVRALFGKRIYLADPALGNTTMTITQFLGIWVEGIGFIVSKKPAAQASAQKIIASDEQLEEITAAGAAPAVPTSAPAPAPNVLLGIKPGEAAPDEDQLRHVMEPADYLNVARFLPTITDTHSLPLLTIFSVQNYNASIQFGDPVGNFIDFSPAPGQPLKINQ